MMMLKAGCLLLLGGTVAANVGSSVSASVSLSASKVFTTQPAFVGATIDWWRNNDPVYGPKFGYGGALTIDLQSPSLRAVASGLAPGWLRIGGTPADGIVYEVHGGECANVSVNPEPTCTQNFTANKCDKCGDAYGCLKWDRWVELLTFANATGMNIIFGLNGCRGRHGPDTPMDFSNIQALLTKTVATGLGDLLHGVELGNELIKGYVHAGQMAKDFTTLSGIVKTLWSGRTKVPILAGADEGRNMPAFLKALKPNVLTAATFHQYGQCGHDAVPHSHQSFPPVSAPGFALQPTCMNEPEDTLPALVKQVHDNAPPGTQAIIGESALTGGGGADGTTNGFVSSMFYADWLGFAAKTGVSAVFRETLMGGYYEIVNKTSYLPNPDAFTMALFSQLMGPDVLEAKVTVSASAAGAPANVTRMLRGYAHCSRSGGKGTLLLINIASETGFTVALPSPAQTEWHLTPPAGDIHAKAVELNGHLLALVKNNTEMPGLVGLGMAGQRVAIVDVGPASVVFVQLTAAACA